MQKTDTPIEKMNGLFVLGVHRSGTSALAGCLHLLGVNLGSSLSAGNAPGQGTCINQDIVLVHDILLRDLGCRWDMVGTLPKDWVASDAADQAGRKLTRILETQLFCNGPWAVTDPRLCRLMPLWLKILAPLQIVPRFVHLVRHPFEVARSLNSRDGMDLSQGHLVWLVHNRDALRACSDHAHVLLTYDQLLADPVASLQNIAAAIDIVLPRDPVQRAIQLAELVRPDHKHHHSSESARGMQDNGFSQFAWVYDQFRAGQAKVMDAIRTLGHRPDGQCTRGALMDFPLVVAPDATPQVRSVRNHTVAMFNNLLDVIGRYEQSALDESQARLRRLLAATHIAETLYARIYFPIADVEPDLYTNGQSHEVLLAPGEWQEIIWDVLHPSCLRNRQLRFCPLNTLGMVSISHIQLRHTVTGETLWEAKDKAQFSLCAAEGDTLILSTDDRLEVLCTGSAPRILLPIIPDLPDCPMQLCIWMKATRQQTAMHDHWSELNSFKQRLADSLAKERAFVSQSRQSVKSLEKQLAEHQARVDELQSAREQSEKALAALQHEHQFQIGILTEKIKKTESINADLQKRVAQLKQLSGQYYAELTSSEALHIKQMVQIDKNKQDLADIHKRLKQVRHESQQMNRWISKLHHHYRDLMVSRRWRMGNAAGRMIEIIRFRSRRPLAVDHMENLFDQYRKFVAGSSTETARSISDQGALLIGWIDKLQKNFNALMASRRWKLGNCLIRAIEIPLLRPRVPMAPDHMKEIFAQYENWTRHTFQGRPKSAITPKDIQQLSALIKKLKGNFEAMMVSRRWRYGNAAGRFLGRLLFRPVTPMASDHMREIFEKYQKGA